MHVYFNVRAYANAAGGIGNVRVDTVIENSWTYAPSPKNELYSATIRVGQSTTEVTDLKHYQHARWHKVLWSKGDPNVYAKVDTDYLQSTRAISRYAELDPDEKFLDSLHASFPPMTNGSQTKSMGQTGAQAAIGPLPQWTSTYVVSSDRRAFDWMLANDDAAGTYGFHYRDQTTGRPTEITRHPYATTNNNAKNTNPQHAADLIPNCKGDCGSPYTFDTSHHPSIGYVSYLVTGDYYYLEEMQFTAAYTELETNPAYRSYDQGLLKGAQSQVRGQAWALRSLADAAFATPDDDPMKGYFNTLVANIFASYNGFYTHADASKHPIHVLNDYGAVIYPFGAEDRVGIATWQQAFFTWSVGHAAEQGFDGARPFLQWLGDFQVGVMTNWQADPKQGYCWLEASAYSLQVRPAQNAPDFASLDEAYRANFPKEAGLTCNSQEMVDALSASKGSHYVIGEMSGYANSPTGFPSNFQIGLAMAVDSGIANGKSAWEIFDGRTVKPNYADNPNFAVIPRSVP
ncbi:MAG: hypothetical protein ABI379_00410 [Rhodanobacter sp.]